MVYFIKCNVEKRCQTGCKLNISITERKRGDRNLKYNSYVAEHATERDRYADFDRASVVIT